MNWEKIKELEKDLGEFLHTDWVNEEMRSPKPREDPGKQIGGKECLPYIGYPLKVPKSRGFFAFAQVVCLDFRDIIEEGLEDPGGFPVSRYELQCLLELAIRPAIEFGFMDEFEKAYVRNPDWVLKYMLSCRKAWSMAERRAPDFIALSFDRSTLLTEGELISILHKHFPEHSNFGVNSLRRRRNRLYKWLREKGT